MAKCVFCEVDINIEKQFRIAITYHKPVWVACPNCGHLHLLTPITSYDWEGASVDSQKNTTIDHWGIPVVPHIPITKEVLVMSADFEGGGVDNIIDNIGEGVKIGIELRKKNPNLSMTITIKKYTLTDEMIKEIGWRDYFFDSDTDGMACITLEEFVL